ncbi:ROK family protein [Microbacterium sp. ASV49]|uniref:ROK family protein n=1 Tax=Microbacterium candidum TaxID=3041922 RepID=A0ABT7MWZ1_9MICO|nr:ROK family protein [Microbacterium sp. ASV49]MDL9978970.1 ROK family protein [Microbacterium sp. ASV49]
MTLGRGRPILAFDVGGTDIKSALFDADGRAVEVERTPTPLAGADTPAALARRLAEIGSDLSARYPEVRPQAAGVVVPGIVDPERGIGIYASNLGWRDAPIRELAGSALGLPVHFDHDVRAAAWAEHLLGGARAFDDVVVMVIGTGIAGSLIVDGKLHPAGGYAGEIGHSPVADGPMCPCGARGCLETVASAGAIARRYAELAGVVPDGAREVLAHAAGGDPVAWQVLDGAIDALVLALAQLTAVLAPEAIVIGGGLSRAGDALFEPLRTRLDERLSFHRRPLLLPAELGEDAGLLGAALIARERPDAAA